jgi:hypothetical protein
MRFLISNLMEYLIWYNTEKPHRSIGKLPPLKYYLNDFFTPKQSPICCGPLHWIELNIEVVHYLKP